MERTQFGVEGCRMCCVGKARLCCKKTLQMFVVNITFENQ